MGEVVDVREFQYHRHSFRIVFFADSYLPFLDHDIAEGFIKNITNIALETKVDVRRVIFDKIEPLGMSVCVMSSSPIDDNEKIASVCLKLSSVLSEYKLSFSGVAKGTSGDALARLLSARMRVNVI